MLKKVKLRDLDIGSYFVHDDGRRGLLMNLTDMGALVQYTGKKQTYISSSASVLVNDDQEDSPSWIYDDGGRQEAGYKGDAGDCVCRAIAIATGLPYQQVYDRLAEGNATQRKGKKTKYKKHLTGVRTARHGIYTNRKWFKDYMKELGFVWVSTCGIGTGFQAHMNSDELPMGRLVVRKKRHLAAFIDGVLHDTYDCSWGGKVGVYGYWELR